MESFSNSSKQLQRRQEREAALQRMQQAADLIISDANDENNGSTSPADESNRSADEPTSYFDEYQYQVTDAVVVDEIDDDSSMTSALASVASASVFLRETQLQHKLDQNQNSALASELPVLSDNAQQFLWDESSMTSAYSNRNDNINLRDFKNLKANIPSTASRPSRLSGIRGKGMRWQAVNSQLDDGLAALGAQVFNKLPLWGGGKQHEGADDADVQSVNSTPSKYRDSEGERLLNMANERLGPGSTSSDLPAPLEADEEIDAIRQNDYSFDDTHNINVNSEYGEVNEPGEPDAEQLVRRHVSLDKDGNVRYDHNYYNDDDLHRRRMRSSYKRMLKRPIVAICVVAACLIVIIAGCAAVLTHAGRQIFGWGNASSSAQDEFDWAEYLNKLEDGGAEEDERIEAIKEETAKESEERLSNAQKMRFDHIRFKLVQAKASSPGVFEDEQSAQFAALNWLTREDPRQLDPESVYLKQRYGLAVLWFSTTKSGFQWHVPAVQDEGSGRSLRTLNQNNADTWFRHDHWLSEDGICGWEGVSCHPHDGSNEHDPSNDGDVSHLELRRNNLQGLIPDELYRTLPYVHVIDLSDNGLSGTISAEIVNLKSIEALNLTDNNIGGTLAAEIGQLEYLKLLFMGSNLFKGDLPHTLGMLKKLKDCDLSLNEFESTIPFEMGDMKALSSLNLSWNKLVGPMPHEFSELQYLVHLDVSHNNLGGPLITELMYIPFLETLRLNDNHFSGVVPTEIGNLVHLELVHLNDNDLRGKLPGQIADLEGLESLNLANNHLSGELPPEMSDMSGLQHFDASNNNLRGALPQFIDGMTSLHTLNLAVNDFTGSIPPELGSLYKLEYVYLENNELIDHVPKELGQLTNLRKLVLHNNYLTGHVDESICRLADEMFLTHISVDCGGETSSMFCDCCICHEHEPLIHITETEP